MKITNDPKKIKEVLERSVDTLYPDRKAFEEVLNSGRQLRVYMGIDPTATYAHLGHATNYIILKRLHDLGHKIIVLIGDFTAMIGDPSDKNAARKRLTREDVENNMKTFRDQIGKILDFNNAENPIEFRCNSEWLTKLTFTDSVELASHFTVQRMLERDNFHRRIQENKPLYVHEFFYPLMQGYDSVALDADVEIGGTDQTFNMLAGRTLVRAYQNREKLVMTTTLLENPVTGEKLMSKSLGTGIGLDETPNNMFGKTMALPDEAILQVFVDCTYKTMDEIGEIREALKNGMNPRDLKVQLAREIVKIYHNEKAADDAEQYFVNTFKKKEMPEEMPEIMPTIYELAVALLEGGLVKSKSLARQVIDQGGVKLNGEKVGEGEYTKQLKSGDVIQKGARFFVRIK
jgi:tyrosyl-tRNA synthetase